MKITRFAQSCLLIETNGKRILVDPGNIFFEESLLTEYRHDIDVLLVTHKHSDHCHVPAILDILKSGKTVFYTTAEVANAYAELHPTIAAVGDVLHVENITIRVLKSFHGFLPHLKGGNEIFEGVGYIIDDGSKKLYTTGDSLCFSTDEVCDILCVPVCNHGLVMGPFEAARFAQQVQATLVIPYHYDNKTYPVELSVVEAEFKNQNIPYRVVGYRETIEV